MTGTYQQRSEISQRLLAALPQRLVITAQSWQNPLVAYLAEEIDKEEPGQEAVLDRLLDLLLIAVLRAWIARPEACAPGWYSAHSERPRCRPSPAAAAGRTGAAVDRGFARCRS